MIFETFILVLVAVLWGCTNPFIKSGTVGIEKIKGKTKFSQILLELKFLFTNWKYIIPFLINQSGSLAYIFALQIAPMSLVVPVTNSLTFVFTDLTGKLLGEKSPPLRTYIGMLFILCGTTLCVLDKVYPIDVSSILMF
ncbi:transmembrane protein 234 homolog [Chrysoperla carnea]|uniref:transmembrane protein 234 homolog n=1 Tax=Chrysoperla carnea TaxID=189513 RepID=UPI001D084649|nr:transmembrane protein 234 homolog [Chrysoperla carnea]XP_044735138.1 transmembrane protein 234 homolog [Chrysoperla carnea]